MCYSAMNDMKRILVGSLPSTSQCQMAVAASLYQTQTGAAKNNGTAYVSREAGLPSTAAIEWYDPGLKRGDNKY